MNIPNARAAIEAARELLAGAVAKGWPSEVTADKYLQDALAELEPSADDLIDAMQENINIIDREARKLAGMS